MKELVYSCIQCKSRIEIDLFCIESPSGTVTLTSFFLTYLNVLVSLFELYSDSEVREEVCQLINII